MSLGMGSPSSPLHRNTIIEKPKERKQNLILINRSSRNNKLSTQKYIEENSDSMSIETSLDISKEEEEYGHSSSPENRQQSKKRLRHSFSESPKQIQRMTAQSLKKLEEEDSSESSSEENVPKFLLKRRKKRSRKNPTTNEENEERTTDQFSTRRNHNRRRNLVKITGKIPRYQPQKQQNNKIFNSQEENEKASIAEINPNYPADEIKEENEEAQVCMCTTGQNKREDLQIPRKPINKNLKRKVNKKEKTPKNLKQDVNVTFKKTHNIVALIIKEKNSKSNKFQNHNYESQYNIEIPATYNNTQNCDYESTITQNSDYETNTQITENHNTMIHTSEPEHKKTEEEQQQEADNEARRQEEAEKQQLAEEKEKRLIKLIKKITERDLTIPMELQVTTQLGTVLALLVRGKKNYIEKELGKQMKQNQDVPLKKNETRKDTIRITITAIEGHEFLEDSKIRWIAKPKNEEYIEKMITQIKQKNPQFNPNENTSNRRQPKFIAGAITETTWLKKLNSLRLLHAEEEEKEETEEEKAKTKATQMKRRQTYQKIKKEKEEKKQMKHQQKQKKKKKKQKSSNENKQHIRPPLTNPKNRQQGNTLKSAIELSAVDNETDTEMEDAAEELKYKLHCRITQGKAVMNLQSITTKRNPEPKVLLKMEMELPKEIARLQIEAQILYIIAVIYRIRSDIITDTNTEINCQIRNTTTEEIKQSWNIIKPSLTQMSKEMNKSFKRFILRRINPPKKNQWKIKKYGKSHRNEQREQRQKGKSVPLVTQKRRKRKVKVSNKKKLNSPEEIYELTSQQAKKLMEKKSRKMPLRTAAHKRNSSTVAHYHKEKLKEREDRRRQMSTSPESHKGQMLLTVHQNQRRFKEELISNETTDTLQPQQTMQTVP